MIELDGSEGEGGGQILRTSLALSLITRQPFRLRNIRARRPKPGLQAQHLMCVQAAAAIGNAKLRGASLHSSDLVFEPGDTAAGNYHFRIGTAGATSLVLHTLYLPLALASGPSTIHVEGGTHVKASPSFHFLQATWRAYMGVVGIPIELTMHRPGFYPRGGGLIEARVSGDCRVQGLRLESLGTIEPVAILSAVSGLPENIAKRQSGRAYQRLKTFGLTTTQDQEVWSGAPGTMLALEMPTQPAPTLFFGLGEKGKPAERVADEAVDQLVAYLRRDPPAVDAHSADQLVLPLALAKEPSSFPIAEVTQHLLTNIAVIGRFLVRQISCDGAEGERGTVTIP